MNRIIIFLCGIYLFFPLFASDLVLDLADRFEADSNYNEAITELERFLFFNSDSPLNIDIMVRISDNFKRISNINEANYWLSKAINLTIEGAKKDSLKLKLLPLLIAEKNYTIAEINAVKLIYFSKSEIIKKQAHFYLGLIYLYCYEWEKGCSEFILSSDFQDFISNINKMKNQVKFTKFKSPQKAKWFSTFIPGLGQLYAGDYRNAVNAFALNAITIGLLTTSYMQEDFLQILLSDAFLFERYYSGNRVKAEIAAQNYNQNLNNELFQDFVEVIYSDLNE